MEEKKEHISGRVSAKGIQNITNIASAMKWSFNQTIEYAMEHLTLQQVIENIKNNQTKQS